MLIFGAALALVVWTATMTYWVLNRKRKTLPQAPPSTTAAQTQDVINRPPLPNDVRRQLDELRRRQEADHNRRWEISRSTFPAFPEFPNLSENIERAMQAVVGPHTSVTTTTTRTVSRTPITPPSPATPAAPPPPVAATPPQPRSVYERLRDPWPTTATDPETPETPRTGRKTS